MCKIYTVLLTILKLGVENTKSLNCSKIRTILPIYMKFNTYRSQTVVRFYMKFEFSQSNIIQAKYSDDEHETTSVNILSHVPCNFPIKHPTNPSRNITKTLTKYSFEPQPRLKLLLSNDTSRHTGLLKWMRTVFHSFLLQ